MQQFTKRDPTLRRNHTANNLQTIRVERLQTERNGTMMTKKTTVLRRLAAGVGAIALALVGVGAMSTAASAAQPADGTAPGNAPAGSTGTLTIHKFAGSPTSQTPPNGTLLDPGPARPPLAHANFSFCLLNNLATEADWTAAKNADASTVACPGGTWTSMTPTDSSGITSVSLAMGAYIVKEVAPFPEGVSSGPAFIVTIPYPSVSGTEPNTTTTWLWDVNTYPKNTMTPGGGKTVADPTTHGLGSTVPWTITSRALGSFGDGAPLTSYKLIDQLVPQLQYEATQSLQYQTPGGAWTDVPNSHYSITPAAPATSGGGQAVVEFNPGGVTWLNGLQAGTKLQWKLTTKVVGVGSLENKSYENTGGDDVQTGSATTQWGQAVLKKHHAGDTQKVLKGAEFEVYNSTGGACTTLGSQVTVTVGGTPTTIFVADDNGLVNIAGLWVGSNNTTADRVYCVKETKAPAGYTLPANPVSAITVVPGAVAQGSVTLNVPNNPTQGPNLPLTGAAGTAAMSIGGLALVALGAAAIVLARRVRREHADQ